MIKFKKTTTLESWPSKAEFCYQKEDKGKPAKALHLCRTVAGTISCPCISWDSTLRVYATADFPGIPETDIQPVEYVEISQLSLLQVR